MTGGRCLQVAKDHLTEENVPCCQCTICLYGFAEGDVFTKTQCYHYFHSHCLGRYVSHALGQMAREHEAKLSPAHEKPESPDKVPSLALCTATRWKFCRTCLCWHSTMSISTFIKFPLFLSTLSTRVHHHALEMSFPSKHAAAICVLFEVLIVAG